MTKIACPTCQKLTEYLPQNAFRPFCSERCKLIDFGSWANESYKIASTDDPLHDDESATSSLPEE